MKRADIRELDQLVRQHLRAGWYPALAACESAETFVSRHWGDRSSSRLHVIEIAARIAHNRSL